jgi:hypothetical protein
MTYGWFHNGFPRRPAGLEVRKKKYLKVLWTLSCEKQAPEVMVGILWSHPNGIFHITRRRYLSHADYSESCLKICCDSCIADSLHITLTILKLYNEQRNVQVINVFIYLLLPYMFRVFFTLIFRGSCINSAVVQVSCVWCRCPGADTIPKRL